MKTGIIPMTQSGAILGRPGQYKSPPFLMMPGNPILEEFIIYDFNYEVENKPLEVVPYQVKAYTFYCDSIAWDGMDDTLDTSGDGTLEKPWRNVNHALHELQCIINTFCCAYIQLKIKGTINYTIKEYIDGKNKFIMAPWENESIDIDLFNMNNGIRNISGSILIGFNVHIYWDVNQIKNVLYIEAFIIDRSQLYSCNANLEIEINTEVCPGNEVTGFDGSNNILYQCNSNAKNSFTQNYDVIYGGVNTIGYEGYNSCHYYYCSAKLNSVFKAVNRIVISECYGFVKAKVAIGCSADVTGYCEISNIGYPYAEVYGFYYGDTFYNCIANVNAIAISAYCEINIYAYGFYRFNNCLECNANMNYQSKYVPNSDGTYWFTERVCGFRDDESICYDPCHLLIHDGGVTTDYCNS